MPEEKKKDEPMVDLDTTGNPVDVEVKDSNIEEVKEEIKEVDVKTEEAPKVEEVKEKTDELEEYSEDVKKRIGKLTYKLRESERREKEAINFAQQVKGEKDQLQKKVISLDKGYLTEYDQRVDSQTGEAKNKLKQAVEAGDVDAQVVAQQEIAKLAIEKERVRATLDEQKQKAEAPQPEQKIVEPKQPAKVDPKAEAWASKNPWFGTDETMTYGSFAIHKKMVDEDGFDPNSDDYYSEIDKRIRKEFPHKFIDGGEINGSTKPVQTVASAVRKPMTGRKTVRLTPSQVAIAKKLGVPLEEYAKYVKEA